MIRSPRENRIIGPWLLAGLCAAATSGVASAQATDPQPPAQEAPAEVEGQPGRALRGREDAPADISRARWQEEYSQLNQVIQRYSDGVQEFQVDVQQTIDQKYEEELERYQRTYDALLRKLQDEVTVRRKEAIAGYEQFLQRYPDSPHSAIAMVRLAELYFEEAQIDFTFVDAEYEKAWDEYKAGKRSTPPPDEEPELDFSRSLALYDQVLKKFPTYKDVDGVYYMKGFILGKEGSTTHDAAAAKDAFLALIQDHPESDYAFQAFLLVGDYYFDQNQLEQSIVYYQQAMSYKDKPWDRALYKLAWAQYRLGEWDTAIAQFVELLDYSETLKKEQDKDSDLRPEAVQYLAISLADSGSFDDAVRRFNEIGGRPYQMEILTKLADVYVQLARYEDAVDAYQKLQALYPTHPENPRFQAEIFKIYVGLPGGADVEAAIGAQKELVARYNAESEWAAAMDAELNKTAMSHAQEQVRDALKDIAYHYHALATAAETPEPQRLAHFDTASEYYRQYLNRFPYSPDAYELQYYYAECLYNSGRMEEAAREFSKALTYTDPAYHGQAARGVVDAYANLITRSGIREGVFDPLPRGEEKGVPQQVELPPLLKDYAAAIDTYARIDKASDATPKLMLIASRIYYFHYHFDEARRRFDELMAAYPQDDTSLQAAQFLVDSYSQQEDWQAVIESVDRLQALSLGTDAVEKAAVRKTLTEFKSTATFKVALAFMDMDTQDLEVASVSNTKAAEAFLQYADEFPNTELTARSLAYAAIGFEEAGDTERAIEVNKRLIREHPQSEYVEAAYYSIASNYEKAFDFSQAIKYHEELARNFPDSNNAPISLFNATYLRLGMRQYNEAAAGFERYVRVYPNRDDAAAVMFLAAETYEKAGNWREAIRVYREYIQRFPRANGDRVILAHVKIISGLNTLGRGREAVDTERALQSEFVALREAGLLTLRGLNLYAGIAFREVERQYASFKEIKLTGTEKQLAKQFEKKQTALNDLGTTVAELAKLGDVEYRLASFYMLGLAYQTFAAQATELPCPAGLDEFECEMYTEQLREVFVYPMEEQAISIYEKVLSDAKEGGIANQWVDKSYDQLNALQPDFYPIRKPDRLEMVPADRDFAVPPVDLTPTDAAAASR